MKILVTGAHGFIGSRVCHFLREYGHDPVGYDRPHDVRDRDRLLYVSGGVGGVINLAGVLGSAETFDGEQNAAEINIIGALNVFDAFRGVPVVQIGTGHKGQPNPYAITKAAAEDLGLARARYRGEKITVVRAYHAYGPGQKMCPPHGKSTVRKIIPSFVCRALTGMPLEVNGSGEQIIDLVHVDDVAEALVSALDGPFGTVVEAGTGKPTTVLDTAKAVIKVAGSDSPIVHLPMRPGEPEDATVVAAAPACANPWPYRLDETIDWYRKQLAS
jgi:UDP-glucose 4-epimerase